MHSYIGMYVFMHNYVLLNTAGALEIVYARNDVHTIISVTTTVHPDRYEWVKRLPDLSYRHITSKKTLYLNPTSFHDEGYYCVYLYRQEKLLENDCFKLVIISKY